jgi:hypothetical protein
LGWFEKIIFIIFHLFIYLEKINPKNNKPFYYHKASKKTQYERPVAEGSPQLSPSEEPSSTGELPEGWVGFYFILFIVYFVVYFLEKINPKNNKPYYYHKATKKTQYERPVAVTVSSPEVVLKVPAATKPATSDLPEGWIGLICFCILLITALQKKSIQKIKNLITITLLVKKFRMRNQLWNQLLKKINLQKN